ncbi:MAG: 5-formyltetrahydrofolate cyclo-ligase [Clostridia bacterium]|nr:5-formyltetrahydrofolate cyclo-ligase [Clostridia bacterium]
MDIIKQSAETAERKAELRKQLRSMRRALDISEVEAASRSVCAKLASLGEFREAGLILAYMAAKNELDVSYAVSAALELGKRVAFPLCIEDGGLRLLVPNDPSAFTVGSYGILEPDPLRSSEVLPDELELVIVPAVAFSPELQRLGQGGGYYDRLLERTNAFTVGVGYDFQLVSDIPIEKHDAPLDCVILPSHTLVRLR